MTHYTNTGNPIDFPKKKDIPMLEKFAAQSLVEYDGELIFSKEKFAELIVGECCLALWTEECHSSDLAFDEVKRNATRIKEHFGIDPNEITEDMLARSIKWMEQQLADKKKHFGVEE